MKLTTATTGLLLLAASAAPSALAHSPKTPEELDAFAARQASAYHCAPAVAAMTAHRKRSFAQKVLGGDPTQHANLFVDGYFDDLKATANEAMRKAAEIKGKQLMACEPVQETYMKNSTCVLAPQVTEGPYYHTEGHPIRSNMAEWQLGLLFMMNVGVIDVETCEPVPNVLVDLWHANATGFYAGHNPLPADVIATPAQEGIRRGLLPAFQRTDRTETWLRGALPTDNNGVAVFTSVFPGYYTGRATHVHVKVHPEWEALENGTFTSGRLAHTGQFFVDDLLNQEIDKLAPYNENPIRHLPGRGRTRNWEDSLQIFDEAHVGGYMPTFDIEPLGGVLSQGLIGYITMGVNMSANYEAYWDPLSGRQGMKQKS